MSSSSIRSATTTNGQTQTISSTNGLAAMIVSQADSNIATADLFAELLAVEPSDTEQAPVAV